MTEDWQKPQQTIDERLLKLERAILTLQTQIAVPLFAVKATDKTVGASVLALIESTSQAITAMKADITNNARKIDSVTMQLSDNVNAVADTEIDLPEISRTFTRFAVGYEVPASSVRDTSRSLRTIITMLRKQATEHIAKSHLAGIGITVKRKGKFIYFVRGAEDAKQEK